MGEGGFKKNPILTSPVYCSLSLFLQEVHSQWSSSAEEISILRLLECLVFGGGNQFVDFSLFLLINVSVDSEFRGSPSTLCRPD